MCPARFMYCSTSSVSGVSGGCAEAEVEVALPSSARTWASNGLIGGCCWGEADVGGLVGVLAEGGGGGGEGGDGGSPRKVVEPTWA